MDLELFFAKVWPVLKSMGETMQPVIVLDVNLKICLTAVYQG